MTTLSIPDTHTYTPMPCGKGPKSRRRLARAWPICADINDPRLGLNSDQLTRTLEPLGLPPGWSEEVAAELATAAWLYLSRLVGGTASLRQAVPDKLSGLRDIALTEIPGREVPFPEFTDAYFERGAWDGFLGYGSYTTPFGRLKDHGPFGHLNAPRVGRHARRTWELRHRTDFEPLDFAWEQAAASANAATGLLPVLDVRALSCFAPARRLVTRDDGDTLLVPSAWEFVAVVLAQGPDDFRARAQQLILHLSNPTTVSARSQPYKRATVERVQSTANGLIDAVEDSRRMLKVLDGWANAPRVKMEKSTRRRLDKGAPVLAPSVQRVRRRRAELSRELARARKSRKPGSAWVRTTHHAFLKKLILLDLGSGSYFRVGEIARLKLKDVVATRDFVDGQPCPAIYGEWSKSDGTITDHWVPIRQETYALIAEWIAEWGLTQPDGPLFPKSAIEMNEFALPAGISSFFSGNGSRNAVLVADDGSPFGEHSFRHLGEQLGVAVGRLWLAANPEWVEQLQSQVFADAANHHVFSAEVHAYKDLEQQREKWAFRAFMGDANLGVPGTLDLIFGDEGARKVWDVEGIRSALSRAAEAHERFEIARAERDESDASVAGLQRQLDRYATDVEYRSPDVATLELRAIKTLEIQERAVLERRYQAERRMGESERMLLQAQHDLELIGARGRSVVIPDETPLAHELLAGGQLVAEAETFEAASERVRQTVSVKLVDVSCDDSGEVLLREREFLNFHEAAGVMDVAPKTFGRWVDGTRRGPLSYGALRAAVVDVSGRRRFIAVDQMPAEWWNGLSVAQREMVEQILRVPMGMTQFAGPAMDVTRIRAVASQFSGA